jgi:hypothetical protein
VAFLPENTVLWNSLDCTYSFVIAHPLLSATCCDRNTCANARYSWLLQKKPEEQTGAGLRWEEGHGAATQVW